MNRLKEDKRIKDMKYKKKKLNRYNRAEKEKVSVNNDIED